MHPKVRPSVLAAGFLAGARDLPQSAWQHLATDDDPFASREFLGGAEACGAAGETMGWRPMHLALKDRGGAVRGLLPLYRRNHSFGDFARDWNWPTVWRHAGLAYYPKLVSGIPYTPSPGPRLLAADDGTAAELAAAAVATAAEFGASSWQCLFVRERDRGILADAGLLMRRGVQFHWRNRGYRDFADFLEGFNAAKRKKLKRERRAVVEAGLRIETRHGDELDPPLWKAVHRHYRDTFERYGNYPAFPLEFFREAGAALGRRMVVFVAFARQRPVASAICYRGGATLYGRHWGCDGDRPGLHFELSYYQGIEYAIRHGLERFEAGSGGEHKLARGFEPTPTWSAYWIADARMRDIVADFIVREDAAMLDYEAETAERLPYKAGSSP
ncbi:MAG TPA: GNAT family N-acetyltransferase [Rhodocyclaceae bacterium]